MKLAALLACLLALALPVHAAAPSATPDLAKAESLIREGRAAEAYDLLQPLEAQAAGDADFDYWLGVAALEAGKPDKATIALERALIVNPDFVGARLDLARAYFAMGDFDRARLEFKTVLEQDPPAGARATVDRYLAEIDSRSKLRRPLLTAYLEATLGHDTNVNNSTRDAAVFVPLFGLNLALAPTSIKSSDNYFGLGGGVDALAPVTDEAAVFAGLDYRHRLNFSEKDFDFNRFDGRVGLQFAKGQNLFRGGVSYGRYYLDNRYNYESIGVALEWRHAINDRNIASLIGLRNHIRFPDPTLEGNNANQSILGVGWLHALNSQGTTFIFGSINFGRERDTNNRVDGERKLWGGRLVGQYNFSPNWDAYASLAAQFSDYETENFVFLATRKDRFYEAALGLIWRLERDWTLRPQIAYTRNNSNIAIYEYDRFDISVTLRRDFK